ncbi:hypothetical protein [Luteimonas salinilitoris]|uniref:Uncharacterized protein n=1 Tax=Luteimonas salinilitoris TaxID=3237697 RepID=A0ABV4HTK4_9GAMM
MLSIRSAAALAFALACLPTAVFAGDAPMYEPDAENPPPSLPLNSFQRFDALPVAMGAAWSFGATDKTMLIRVSTMISEYLRQNHAQAVGGSISQAPEVDGE